MAAWLGSSVGAGVAVMVGVGVCVGVALGVGVGVRVALGVGVPVGVMSGGCGHSIRPRKASLGAKSDELFSPLGFWAARDVDLKGAAVA